MIGLGSVGGMLFLSTMVLALSPGAPVITQLPPETYATSVTLNWTAATSSPVIDRYYVQYTSDPKFVSSVTTIDVGNVKSYTVNGLSYNKIYYFRVYAKGTDGKPANMNLYDPVTNPDGVQWSAITRTQFIPSTNRSTQSIIHFEITPAKSYPNDNVFYSNSKNQSIKWVLSGVVPIPGNVYSSSNVSYLGTSTSSLIQIAGGLYFSIGMKSDGTVLSWGSNQYGQLGNGTTCDRNVPWLVMLADGTSLMDVSMIAAGDYHALALMTDGTVWTWGYNAHGELGDGTTTNRSNPVQVKLSDGTPLTDVIAIAGGRYHSVALKTDGTVWSWGYNSNKQIGNGNTTTQKYPVQVKINSTTYLTDISQIAVGALHTIALKTDGTAWTWGYNGYGQIGNGNTTNQGYAAQVKSTSTTFLTDVSAVSAGICHSLALKNDGTVWTWGYNNYGQLGNGSNGSGTDQKFPVQAKQLGGSYLTDICQVQGAGNHSLALKSDGTVLSWGTNANGELGDGSISTSQNTAIQMILPDGSSVGHIVGIYGGASDTFLVQNIEYSSNTVLSCGANSYGQLGDGSRIQRLYPIPVMTELYGIACGSLHSINLKNDGTVWACGNNASSQLADNQLNRNILGQVNLAKGTALTDVIGVTGGFNHTIALKNDGTVWTWGDYALWYVFSPITGESSSAVVGSGQEYPTQIKLKSGVELTNMIAIAGGDRFSISLKNDGTVWTWGNNSDGELGDGTTTDQTNPVQMKTLTNIVAVAGGGWHTIALKNDGTVWTCGNNDGGQLGNGTTTGQTKPIQVKTLTDIIAIAGGGWHTIALKNDGTVWTWGRNNFGQLGNGSSTDQTNPVQVVLENNGVLSGVIAVAGGFYHTIALKNDGTVWAWGYNGYGQLGDGTITNRSNPVQVKLRDGTALTNIVSIAVGAEYTMALKNDGTLWAWGNNDYGQLGDGTYTDKLYAVQVLTGSRLTVSRYIEQPTTYTEYSPIPINGYPALTNWNLDDGNYLLNIGDGKLGSMIWSPGIRLTVDTTPPDPFTITTETTGWTTNPQPIISFNTTDATSGLDHYELAIDDGTGTVLSASPYTLPSLTDGVHQLKVSAFDKAGNHRDAITTVSIDTTQPIVSIISPVTNAEIKGVGIIQATAGDAVSGVASVEIYIDNIKKATFTQPPYDYSFNLNLYLDHTIHTITVKAYDGAGNTAQSSINVTTYCSIETSGTLSENQTWSGTVTLTGDVMVPKDITLTIAAGTVITSGNQSDNSNNALIIEGNLVIQGQPGRNVVFQSYGGSWKGIQIKESGSATIDWVAISQAQRALAINSGTATVDNSIFSNNRTGLHVFDTSIQSYDDENPKVRVSNSTFQNNTIYGIKEDGTARPKILKCTFTGNCMDYYSAEDTEMAVDELKGGNVKQ